MPVRRWSVAVTVLAAVLVLTGAQPAGAQGVEDELTAAGDRASAALQRLTEARAAYDQATDKTHEVRVRLDGARLELAKTEAQVDRTRERLRGYVAALFRGDVSGLGTFGPLLTAEDPADFINRAGLLEVTNARQGQVLATLTAERARADKLADETAQLADDLTRLEQQAAESLAAAEAARQEAEALVARAQHDVASRDAARLAAAIAATKGGARTLVIPGFPIDGGSCGGKSVAGYPNGRIPTSLLCPLWGAPGMSLRADATAAFDLMSQEYAATFGDPICVIDGYRSYDQQVSVKSARGSLAATPGTSNHGWGLAVDLCGGIERFGTAQHQWMRNNAPAYGYFHPDWAQRDGSEAGAVALGVRRGSLRGVGPTHRGGRAGSVPRGMG